MDMKKIRTILEPAQAAAGIRTKVETQSPCLTPSRRYSKRTYYLGAGGRVSQRRELVGTVVRVVRAEDTAEAEFLFMRGGGHAPKA